MSSAAVRERQAPPRAASRRRSTPATGAAGTRLGPTRNSGHPERQQGQPYQRRHRRRRSLTPEERLARTEDSRARKSRAFSTQREVSAINACHHCMTVRKVPVGSVDPIVAANSEGHVFMQNVNRCGSQWVCPYCAPKVREARAAEIDGAVAYAMRELGWSVYFVTLTMPHDYSDRLRETLKTVIESWSSVNAGKGGKAMRERFSVEGYIRAVEITEGKENGWHPHLHFLIFSSAEIDPDELHDALYDRWAYQIQRRGYGKPSRRRGVDVCRVEDTGRDGVLGQYLAKIEDGWGAGLELTRLDLKKGKEGRRTPWQIFYDFQETGDLADLELWNEYERATKGRAAQFWSRGLMKVLQVKERSDQEHAEEEPSADDETFEVVVPEPELELLIKLATLGKLQNDIAAYHRQQKKLTGSAPVARMYLSQWERLSGRSYGLCRGP